MTRNVLREAEENNVLGTGALTDPEAAEFTATVDYLRSVIPAAFGTEWNDLVFSGDGYVVTELQRGGSGYFRGYRGVRKTDDGYAVMSGDERSNEGGSVTFSRFEDAVKGYAANIVSSFRGRGPDLPDNSDGSPPDDSDRGESADHGRGGPWLPPTDRSTSRGAGHDCGQCVLSS